MLADITQCITGTFNRIVCPVYKFKCCQHVTLSTACQAAMYFMTAIDKARKFWLPDYDPSRPKELQPLPPIARPTVRPIERPTKQATPPAVPETAAPYVPVNESRVLGYVKKVSIFLKIILTIIIRNHSP